MRISEGFLIFGNRGDGETQSHAENSPGTTSVRARSFF